MKALYKVIITIIICSCISISYPHKVNAATGDEIRAAKKIISVVYDDSSSMFGDNWVYTNYAMQTLTAQLNEQDELYITYMSEPTKARTIGLTDVNGAVSDIRNWTQYGGTPGESIDTAKTRLDGISEDDSSTQFWLVVLTDGQISMNTTMWKWLSQFLVITRVRTTNERGYPDWQRTLSDADVERAISILNRDNKSVIEEQF